MELICRFYLLNARKTQPLEVAFPTPMKTQPFRVAFLTATQTQPLRVACPKHAQRLSWRDNLCLPPSSIQPIPSPNPYHPTPTTFCRFDSVPVINWDMVTGIPQRSMYC